jgi:hypothetical protein
MLALHSPIYLGYASSLPVGFAKFLKRRKRLEMSRTTVSGRTFQNFLSMTRPSCSLGPGFQRTCQYVSGDQIEAQRT